MIIDLHTHTTWGSGDSIISPDQLVEVARRVGLDGVCITEHGNRRFEGVEELARKHDFLVLSGMEASTELGDILVFGLDSYPRVLHRARDLREFVVEAGGVMVAAHPFRYDLSQKPWLRPPRTLTIEQACARPIFQLVDAMEVVNSWASEEDVEFAMEVSRRLFLPGSAGSDAHIPQDIGLCATVFENEIRSEEDLVRELKLGKFTALDRRQKEQKSPTHWF